MSEFFRRINKNNYIQNVTKPYVTIDSRRSNTKKIFVITSIYGIVGSFFYTYSVIYYTSVVYLLIFRLVYNANVSVIIHHVNHLGNYLSRDVHIVYKFFVYNLQNCRIYEIIIEVSMKISVTRASVL